MQPVRFRNLNSFGARLISDEHPDIIIVMEVPAIDKWEIKFPICDHSVMIKRPPGWTEIGLTYLTLLVVELG